MVVYKENCANFFSKKFWLMPRSGVNNWVWDVAGGVVVADVKDWENRPEDGARKESEDEEDAARATNEATMYDVRTDVATSEAPIRAFSHLIICAATSVYFFGARLGATMRQHVALKPVRTPSRDIVANLTAVDCRAKTTAPPCSDPSKCFSRIIIGRTNTFRSTGMMTVVPLKGCQKPGRLLPTRSAVL